MRRIILLDSHLESLCLSYYRKYIFFFKRSDSRSILFEILFGKFDKYKVIFMTKIIFTINIKCRLQFCHLLKSGCHIVFHPLTADSRKYIVSVHLWLFNKWVLLNLFWKFITISCLDLFYHKYLTFNISKIIYRLGFVYEAQLFALCYPILCRVLYRKKDIK